MARKLVVEIVGDASSLEKAFARTRTATNELDRNLGKSGRGVLAVAAGYRSLGRSIAFAAVPFVGAAGLTSVLKNSVEQAEASEKAYAALATAIGHTGGNAAAALPQTRAWADEQARFGVSATEAVTGLARLVELTGSERKAMEAYTAALVISKATGKDFNTVELAVGKAFAGQTTALSRYIGKIQTGTTATQLMQIVMRKYGGQAEANTLATDRLRAEFTNMEQVIGAALLPTVENLSDRLATWLSDSQNQARVQRDVTHAVHDATVVFDAALGVIKDVDKVTGSFVNTLELLIGLKIARLAAGIGDGLFSIGSNADAAEKSASRLQGTLSRLSKIGEITVGVDLLAHATGDKGAKGFLESVFGAGLVGLGVAGPEGAAIAITADVTFVAAKKLFSGDSTDIATGLSKSLSSNIKPGFTTNTDQIAAALATATREFGQRNPVSQVLQQLMTKVAKEIGATGVAHITSTDVDNIAAAYKRLATDVGSVGDAASSSKSQVEDFLAAAAKIRTGPVLGPAIPTTTGGAAPAGLTAAQRNTFFDNAIARILLRGGLGDIQEQIAALERADELIQQRLNVTKDVTRRLNLEDELLQNQAQIRQLKAEQAAASLQAAQDAHQKLVDALTAKADARKARQFRELGFTATGENVVPAVPRLKRELGTVEDALKGTVLDTPLMEKRVRAIQKVLSEGLVPRDIRERIQEMLTSIRQSLDNFESTDLTKWKHESSAAFVDGIPGLTPQQKRQLAARFSALGPGGTLPPGGSGAFAAVGAGDTVVNTTVNLDGSTVAKNTTRHQRRQQQQTRSPSRRGPYAGRT